MVCGQAPTNAMLTGLPVSITWPVGVSVPCSWSTRKVTIESVAWLAA
jgi:hypothetical protein